MHICICMNMYTCNICMDYMYKYIFMCVKINMAYKYKILVTHSTLHRHLQTPI